MTISTLDQINIGPIVAVDDGIGLFVQDSKGYQTVSAVSSSFSMRARGHLKAHRSPGTCRSNS